MAGYRRNGYRSSGRSSYRSNYGAERARQHIEDAKRLSVELGGMDQEVKEIFFALDDRQMGEILREYGLKNGEAAKAYAAATIPKWRTGTVQMSGTVAERLFSLIPPRLPLQKKFALTEGLWKHVGPSSKKSLRIGLDASVEDVVAAARSHIEGVVSAYRIPDNMEKRFQWLSSGDVRVKQDLLAHLQSMERDLVVDGARAQVPVMLQHLRSDEEGLTHRMAQVLKVGKHELELVVDRNANGVTLEDPKPFGREMPNATSSGGFNAIGWIVMLVIVFVIFMVMRR